MSQASYDSILIKLLASAARTNSLVVGFSPWKRLRGLGAMPFRMHLECPGAIPELGLHAKFAVAPWYSSHFDEILELSCRGDNVWSIRKRARVDRKQKGLDKPRDFILADWEDAIARNHDLQDALFPPTALVPIDVVSIDGHIQRGSRPLIGQHIRRVQDTIRPRVIIPASNRASPELAKNIAAADILLLDLQEIRGTKTLEAIRLILALRRSALPTLVLLNTPSTLLTLGREVLLDAQEILIAGPWPEPSRVVASLVNAERLQEEREFHYLVGELKGRDPALDRVVAAATSAWWVLNQNVGQRDSDEPALRRFEREFENLASVSPYLAHLLAGGAEMLRSRFRNPGAGTERLETTLRIVETHLNASIGPSLVLVRNARAALFFQKALAARLGVDPSDLTVLGVHVRSAYVDLSEKSVNTVIATGFFGPQTADAILGTFPHEIHLVLDPIECHTATALLRQMIAVITGTGAQPAAHPLENLRAEIEAKAPPISNELLSINIAVIPETLDSGAREEENPEAGLRDKEVPFLRVSLTDGLVLESPADRRFDVIGRSRTVVHVKAAKDLEPGDEVILVESEHQETLSDLLLESLDRGILKQEAAKRREWQALVGTVVATAKINLAKVRRILSELGIEVSYAAVRAWGHGHTVPRHRRVFLLFARAIGITIPDDEILRYFSHCRRWRIQHRLIGRTLVRSMRLARVGRLDPSSVDRISHLWGLDVRDLIEGTRFAIVDDIEVIDGDLRDAHRRDP